MRHILDLVQPMADAPYAAFYSFAAGGAGGRYYDVHKMHSMRHATLNGRQRDHSNIDENAKEGIGRREKVRRRGVITREACTDSTSRVGRSLSSRRTALRTAIGKSTLKLSDPL